MGWDKHSGLSSLRVCHQRGFQMHSGLHVMNSLETS